MTSRNLRLFLTPPPHCHALLIGTKPYMKKSQILDPLHIERMDDPLAKNLNNVFLQVLRRSSRKMGENNPKLVLLFCGKRKSGKDYMTDWLLECLKKSGKSAVILKLSGDQFTISIS